MRLGTKEYDNSSASPGVPQVKFAINCCWPKTCNILAKRCTATSVEITTCHSDALSPLAVSNSRPTNTVTLAFCARSRLPTPSSVRTRNTNTSATASDTAHRPTCQIARPDGPSSPALLFFSTIQRIAGLQKCVFLGPDLEIAVDHNEWISSFILQPLSFQAPTAAPPTPADVTLGFSSNRKGTDSSPVRQCCSRLKFSIDIYRYNRHKFRR